MNERYKRFPPVQGHLRIPASSRRAALAGLSMYTPCKPLGVCIHRAAWAIVWLFGPRALPGHKQSWFPPLEQALWSELVARWRKALGPFDTAAIYQRLQVHRSGVMLLLIQRGRPIAFVKLMMGDSSALSIEAHTLTAVSKFRPRSFFVPEPLLLEEVSGLHYLSTAPLPPRPHRVPRHPPLRLIVEEIEAALADVARSPEIPAHWRPMHGDFTPWNLRQLFDDSLVLIDWEEAGWGPPGADEVLYRAAAAALRREPASSSDAYEAIAFWEARVRDRLTRGERDQRLARSLLKSLRGMRASRKVVS